MNKKEAYTLIYGKRLYYKMINPHWRNTGKPLLVFLHEGLGSAAQWKDFPAMLCNATGCPGLVYDRVGYGCSEASDKLWAADFLHDEAFEQLPGLLEKLSVSERVIPIGHSDGGTIALLYAARFPEKTAALISEADHVICEEETQQSIKNLVEKYENGRLKQSLSKIHGKKADALFYGWSGFLLSEEGKQWNIVNHLKQVQCPVLAIQGTNDPFGTRQQLTVKLNHISGNVHIALLNECGHIPHVQKKDEVLPLMTEFIARYQDMQALSKT